MPRILITGSNGQVGFELRRALAPLGEVIGLTRRDMDLGDPASIVAALDRHQPDLIVNPAAYTAVDKAESEPELARAVNAVAPGVMAQWGAVRNVPLVHYSTDYVFEGTGVTSYREDASVNPQSVYGATKCDGESAVRQAFAKHLILRTSWVVGAHGSNFLKTILRLARERDQLRIVADQTGAPTSAALIADVTAHLVARYFADREHFAFGTYHLAASGETNWCEYACHVVALAEARGIDLKLRSIDIAPIATHEYPLPATRPMNSRLDCSKLMSTFGITLPDWRSGVDYVFDQLHD
ncbi:MULTISPECIES: dTDP-4-dehydrorhamnose reductase [Burkholderia]|uniref:dTDP-4-dehydrorhamnose reductase n=1 Tax=Burkholderia cenocepacia TaxID=95486 RepID=A0ABD4UAH3_9BURK|nr:MULTISPECIES: dTDP-4-dehydrorhamnose reductase [Burkholderia]MCW3695219.1 dTDP-4-dehydrorhamnose reductase [Burkholderia cenocepacia]MCW3703281.1 dTDP-4-dehydrorhamnose reductase [Burkholderia cenocepacia]MCW3711124.1 dTDP-4-dehydrorhamnose reductase [Burkholderia cenocepacia]MCW3719084.1 dTDP-4-dehydrorhamnose reductase [Burkholderia cenocepacia]MCW3727445.1 dTDP-4-dehydrorhamnose reductase [Burkholderia cenocepacia]